MAPQDIQAALRKRPFEPFRLVQTDGTAYEVRHPELLLLGQRSVVVGLTTDPFQTVYERFVTLDLLHVIRMEPVAAGQSNGQSAG